MTREPLTQTDAAEAKSDAEVTRQDRVMASAIRRAKPEDAARIAAEWARVRLQSEKAEVERLQAQLAAVRLVLADADVNGLDDVEHEFAEGYFTALEKVGLALGNDDGLEV